MRGYAALGLIALSLMGWADYRSWGLFDQRAQALSSRSAGGARTYHK
ncbi:hypothetical protein [Niveibacterium sp. SC-1]